MSHDEQYYDEDEDGPVPEEETDDWVTRQFDESSRLSVAELREQQRRREALRRLDEARTQYNMLEVRSVPEWMQISEDSGPAGKLFGDLWGENELTIMFADTGVGKSMLAVQIADSIVRGGSIEPFPMTFRPQQVLYLDFEMTQEQFRRRYSSAGADGQSFAERCEFPGGILRGQIGWDEGLPKRFRSYGEFVHTSIEERLQELDIRVLIVDNITWLVGGGFGSDSAMHLMKGLKQLKSDNDLSILVLAHTSKRSDTQPITINDLAGSKMISNFADNVFAVGRSCHDAGLRYIKQLKQRNTPIRYDSSNVVVYRIETSGAFPRFEFVRYAPEGLYLRRGYDTLIERGPERLNRREIAQTVLHLRRAGLSHRAIAARLNLSKSAVARYLLDK